MVTDHFTFEKKNMFLCLSKSHFSYCSQFHHLHVNTIAIYKVNKDRMSDCLARHQNWFIQENLSGLLKISNCDRSNCRCVLFESIIRINAA